MQSTKRPQNTSVRNFNDTKRKKRTIQTVKPNLVGDIAKGPVTRLEDLSNETIYDIFDYLDFFHVYQSFFNLNIRFRNLLIYSKLSIKININSSISRSNLEHYYNDIVIPCSDRIISFNITNDPSPAPNVPPYNILSSFTRLETLILENINLRFVDNIFQEISSLSNLSTLIIILCDVQTYQRNHFLEIFRLPFLKYLKMNLSESYKISFATTEFSPIEQLVIENQIHFEYVLNILSYVPKLRRLSLNDVGNMIPITKLDKPIPLNHLTHLFINLNGVSFNDFELLIKRYFRSIQVLHITIGNGDEYINANRWEQFILSSMPFLRIFDIYINGLSDQSHASRCYEFNSSFWLERQWFFANQYTVLRVHFSQKRHQMVFYSINPYRRKDYKFLWQMDKLTHLDDQKNNFNSVRHLHISSTKSIENWIHHFPNTTDLTLQNISCNNSNQILTTLKQIISLQNLSTLDILSEYYSFRKVIQLLSLTPNISTVKISRIIIDLREIDEIENSESFQTVSKTNIIRNAEIKQINQLEEVQLLFNLCPRIQRCEIDKCANRPASIVRLLTAKNSDIAPNLISLYIVIDDRGYLYRLNIMVQAKRLLNDWLVIIDENRLHLWR
ncbi:hypothetical protein I4U23_022415 [Adineta vaga]|nr:hypothetical protein I4U23_022415 [Adineta vaga]